MNSGQNAHSAPDHTQTDNPSVHRINVMAAETKTKAGDELGDYTRADTEDQKMDDNKEGDNNDRGNTETGGENVKKLDMMPMSAVKADDRKEGDEEAGRANEKKLDDEKSCCVRNKDCILIGIIIVLSILLIIFIILFGVTKCSLSKLQNKSGVTGYTTPIPGSPSTGVTGYTTPIPGSPSTSPSPPGAIIAGYITTAENYTKSLANTSSLDYKKLENKFIAAVMNFYAQNPATYIPYYERTIVEEFIKEGLQAKVIFEIHFTQLDNDTSLPDAHSVLSDILRISQPWGPIRIISGVVTELQN